ncbi:type II toxin-antitoxin system VapB family antitoxin [Laspinema sp. D1]|uniref:Type II toxin-antitoxin system VapB family antitoxin n=1 Tax=Laspinema palackyanum D2a TaxID=2953684 RepID=A0ABT2MXI3_9CYAN|nr:type II toxin-antitoxin system VapB family antitoxin [Laspinema sp. D2a]
MGIIRAVYTELHKETAKLFMSGKSQAVHLPQSYRFSGDEVVIKRLGNAVVLLPKEDPWQVMFDGIQEFPESLQIERDQSRTMERDPMA